jgi:predicted metal-dependent hydrolase
MSSYTLTKKQLVVPDLGKVDIIKNRWSRKISIRVNPKSVKISIPYKCSFAEGEKFLFQKMDWVKDTYSQLKYHFHFYNQQQIFTLFGIIQMQYSNSNCVTRNERGYVFNFNGDLLDNKYQEYIHAQVLMLVKKEAKTYLLERTSWLASRYHFSFNGVRLSSAITRWGSCSSKNSISLNYRLVFLPKELCDYVILHELVHTVHKNHGREFWATLLRIDSDTRGKDRLLKNYKFTEML